MYIVMLRYIRPIDEVDAVLSEHIEYLDKYYAQGVFLASGRKIPRDGGVILARYDSRDALRAILDLDPFSQKGIAKYEIVEFIPTRTAAGFENLLEQTA